jgi:hypothetical protein
MSDICIRFSITGLSDCDHYQIPAPVLRSNVAFTHPFSKPMLVKFNHNLSIIGLPTTPAETPSTEVARSKSLYPTLNAPFTSCE